MDVSAKEANTFLVVTNPSESAVRAQVTFGGALALDVELPGSKGCGHQPVFSYAYGLPTGATAVTATADDGQPATASLRVGRRKQWVTLMPQAGFPLYLKVTRTKPGFG